MQFYSVTTGTCFELQNCKIFEYFLWDIIKADVHKHDVLTILRSFTSSPLI